MALRQWVVVTTTLSALHSAAAGVCAPTVTAEDRLVALGRSCFHFNATPQRRADVDTVVYRHFGSGGSTEGLSPPPDAAVCLSAARGLVGGECWGLEFAGYFFGSDVYLRLLRWTGLAESELRAPNNCSWSVPDTIAAEPPTLRCAANGGVLTYNYPGLRRGNATLVIEPDCAAGATLRVGELAGGGFWLAEEASMRPLLCDPYGGQSGDRCLGNETAEVAIAAGGSVALRMVVSDVQTYMGRLSWRAVCSESAPGTTALSTAAPVVTATAASQAPQPAPSTSKASSTQAPTTTAAGTQQQAEITRSRVCVPDVSPEVRLIAMARSCFHFNATPESRNDVDKVIYRHFGSGGSTEGLVAPGDPAKCLSAAREVVGGKCWGLEFPSYFFGSDVYVRLLHWTGISTSELRAPRNCSWSVPEGALPEKIALRCAANAGLVTYNHPGLRHGNITVNIEANCSSAATLRLGEMSGGGFSVVNENDKQLLCDPYGSSQSRCWGNETAELTIPPSGIALRLLVSEGVRTYLGQLSWRAVCSEKSTSAAATTTMTTAAKAVKTSTSSGPSVTAREEPQGSRAPEVPGEQVESGAVRAGMLGAVALLLAGF